MQFSQSDIEELKNYFQPKPEDGKSLPDIKSVADRTQFILIEGTVKKLYIAHGGVWNLVGTLS